jgi:hypothetical protein
MSSFHFSNFRLADSVDRSSSKFAHHHPLHHGEGSNVQTPASIAMQCPLWVKSRQLRRKKRCPLYPRTHSHLRSAMLALVRTSAATLNVTRSPPAHPGRIRQVQSIATRLLWCVTERLWSIGDMVKVLEDWEKTI